MEEMLGNLALARQFRHSSEAEMEDIRCRELMGLDLSTKEGLGQLMSSDTPQKDCFLVVGAAYRHVVDLLQGTT